MQLLNGKLVSQHIKGEIANQVKAFVTSGKRAPHLVAILVGEDPASQAYVSSKVKTSLQNIQFNIFPNPTTDWVTIHLNQENSGLFIYNLQGSVVYSNTEKASEIKIPVSEIGGAGVYFVKVNSVVRKLVIN